MSLKPRTFRRVVLLGGFTAVLLIVFLSFFVVRPWQKQRTLESMRTEGMAAAESGDHVLASKLLNRYLSRDENAEPEIVLAHARSRTKYQTSDGGYIRAAIRSYRRYLDLVPDDLTAAQELLPLFVETGMNIEGKTLAERMRSELGDTSIEVLRYQRYANIGLGANDAVLEELFISAAEHPDAQFIDFVAYGSWLQSQNRGAEVEGVIDSLMVVHGDSMDLALVSSVLRLNEINNSNLENSELKAEEYALRDEIAGEIASVIGLDQQTGEWIDGPAQLDPVASSVVDRGFNSLMRPDLSMMVIQASAEQNQDNSSLVWAARRLFWSQDYESLFALSDTNKDGELVPDVLGYKVLAHRELEDDESAANTLESLKAVVLDFRGKLWLEVLDAKTSFDQGRFVEARPKVKEVLEDYAYEPTFRMLMGDIYSELGRFDEANEQWNEANTQVLSEVGYVGWMDPYIRLIEAYTTAGRASEANDYINALNILDPNNGIARSMSLLTVASNARAENFDRDRIRRILTTFEEQAAEFTAEQLAQTAPQVATMYASLEDAGSRAKAAQMIESAIGTSPAPALLRSLIEVDYRYDLGVAQGLGLNQLEVIMQSAQSAFQYALTMYAKVNVADAGLDVIERGAQLSDDADRYQWDLVRAKYLDTIKDDRAVDAWNSLLEQNSENVDLLYQAAESNAFVNDLNRVNSLIDQIVELTSTAGQALPTRLRLARASAIVSNVSPEAAAQARSNGAEQPSAMPTKAQRDRAIEIVRAVVASEQQNVKARTMLARLLSLSSSPMLDAKDRFEPDLNAAADQYVTISRMKNGRSAQRYLIQAVDLCYQGNEDERAIQFLLEFETRFPNDWSSLITIAPRLEKLGEFSAAESIYDRIYSVMKRVRAQGEVDDPRVLSLEVEAGLSLVNVYITQQASRSKITEILTDLRQLPELTRDQLVELASMHTKYEYKAEGQELARSGERYGLSPAEAKLVNALYAEKFDLGNLYQELLQEVVELDPLHEDAWRLLIFSILEQERYEDARAVIAQAKSALPDTVDLKTVERLSKGNGQSLVEMIESGDIPAGNPVVTEAARRYDEIQASRQDLTPSQLADLLVAMIQDFPSLSAVQKMALTELERIGYTPSFIAEYADRASRMAPADPVFLSLSAKANLRMGNAAQAKEIAIHMRSLADDSPVEADLITAQAMVQLGEYADATLLVGQYVTEAIGQPDSAKNLDILLAYSQAQLMGGGDPEMIFAMLSPMLESNEVVRVQIWLTLAAYSIPTHELAARWLETVTPYIQSNELQTLSNTWLVMIERHDAWIPEYAQSAVGLMEQVLASGANNASDVSAMAQAQYALAKSTQNPTQRMQIMARAVERMDQADQLDPSNLAYLMIGAGYANEAGDLSSAEERYRALLDRNIGPSLFLASIHNNLAMVIERRSDDPVELEEAHQLSVQATDMFANPTFWGTRGWVELALGQFAEAEDSFKEAILLDESIVEGWVGLAIAQHQAGPDRTEDASATFDRVVELFDGTEKDEDLVRRLRLLGAEQWTSVIVD